MSIIERDVLWEGKDEQGRKTMDFPITRLGNIEDSAEVKQTLADGDYIPVMDGSDSGQMKKLPYSALEAKLMKPQLLVKTEVGATVTVTNGTVSYQQTSNGEPLAFNLSSFGAWTATATKDGITGTSVSVSVDAVKVYSITASVYKVYGAEWDGSSTKSWTRTDDAAGFTDPVPYVSGATNYSSPFDTIQPWAGMVKSERTGGTMVAIPKFYYRLTQVGTGLKIQISAGERDGFHISPAHMDRGDGKGERDVVYVGRYHCGATAYKSATGQLPKVEITRSAAREAIHALGDHIWQWDFATRFTIQLLYLVEFANWDSQGVIGRGCGNNSAVQVMGASDTMPYHTGTMQTARTQYGVGVQYRYIEGLWDNCLDWMDGCYYNRDGMNIIRNPADFSDTTGGVSIGTTASGYPSAFAVKTEGGFPTFIPTAASGSENSYSCDYWYFDRAYPCLCVGGDYDQVLDYGLFYVDCIRATSANDNVGSRLLELP